MSAALELIDVTRTHKDGQREVAALNHVSLSVAPGEFVAVMGPSGSGKSTLLNVAGGLDAPTSGQVRVAGQELSALKSDARAAVRRHAVGYVFQDYNLLPGLTAAENVSFSQELDGVPLRRARAAALEALSAVGVAELADRFPEDMSGGQAQRVAIARALAGPRRLVLADEPTGALDSHAGEQVLRVLRERADSGASVLLVTHEPRYAAWADRTVFLRDGRIVDITGPSNPDELLEVTP